MKKKDFPIFQNNPGLVFLDSAASTQKPQYVIDGVSNFVSNDYANIHRGAYQLSERSEELYDKSKQLLAEFLNSKASEIIYNYNATHGMNVIAQSLVNSGFLKKGDKILLGIREHHANIVPRQILSKIFGFQIDFVGVSKGCEIDRDDFSKKYDKSVKVVSIGHVSNVTGKIYDVKRIKSLLREDTFFIVDGSQSFPNMKIDVQDMGCDCFVFTAHKVMAYTGIGAMYLKRDWIKKLTPMMSGGGAIRDVDLFGHTVPNDYSKFEAGTPNIIGAISLLKSLEYIKSIGGMEKIREHEQKLVEYSLERFTKLKEKVKLIGPKTNDRTAVFSFFIPGNENFNHIGEIFAQHNIAIRCGGHCAYPMHKDLKIPGTCRMSAYLYNDIGDLEKFFEVLESIVR
ncbi:MAG TPA: aminotransferase class V-fold PLP-dependent enzyme [Candidatus Absconditabacterales bacterium]|nr:aminotransferase class V-fold PLP-dependent enzyme [Candidatus Absconditabacterales bacterium]